jgi:hypothetical protein
MTYTHAIVYFAGRSNLSEDPPTTPLAWRVFIMKKTVVIFENGLAYWIEHAFFLTRRHLLEGVNCTRPN